MRRELAMLAVAGGAGAIGAIGLAVALLGLGMPFMMAAILAGLLLGILLYAWGRWRVERAAAVQAGAFETRACELRHALRGALTPAMLLSDRLLKSDDPKVLRAGKTIVLSIEQAMALLVEDRVESERTTATMSPAAPVRAEPQHAAETAGPAR